MSKKVSDLKNLRKSTISDNNLSNENNDMTNSRDSQNNLINIKSSIQEHDLEAYKEMRNSRYSRSEIDAEDIVNQMEKPNDPNNTPLEEGKKGNKLFLTEHKPIFDNKDLFTFHDLIVPGGRNAKLVTIIIFLNRSV
jgi:hypothetical protein